MNPPRINAQELSSRKLWQLADLRTREQISADELTEVIGELARRCQDLDKLRLLDQMRDAQG